MAYDLIKISALPAATPDESQDIVVGVGDYAKRINYGDVKNDMVGIEPTYTTDTEPYLMRQTANIGIVGKCALNKLVGGSLGWNQTIPKTAPTFTNGGVTFTNNNNGSWTITGTTTAANVAFNLNYVANTKCVIEGHAYFITGCDSTIRIQFVALGSAAAVTASGTTILKFNPTGATATWARFQIADANTTVNATLYPQVIDLTAMFGSIIADYVYGLESATAGSGIAWLSKYIDLGTYHAYDAGSIQSVQATAHVTKDANNNVIGNYPLGSDTLRGYPMLIDDKLTFDGDEKYPNGTTKRKYGIVDMGSLSWTYNSGSGDFAANISAKALGITNIVCAKYPTVNYATVASMPDKSIKGNSGNTYVSVKDSAYTDAATFKTAMSGVYLVYELATPTTESSTSYQKIQTIDADGTESFTTSSPVPVGHETQTPDNILAALSWVGE